MSGEIVVPETPNWLQELEAKREKRLKARLGHETGAGAPCLKCGDKCPGLDLHFWRKCCKICKCSKEEHEVQDDDIYGWAQFQLLGSKPNKIKRKILLPGKKDELELDWAPKGHNDTVDKYLKTLPPEQLPVKGSQAAQDRKQLLQKQIPVHDIDPTLCHELNEDELKKMNDYIAHVKQSCVGVGQIVSLSSIIRGNLHMLNPTEAAIIANRYPKGIPLSEIVKLQSQSRAACLNKNLQKLSLNDKDLPVYQSNSLSIPESNQTVLNNKILDKNYMLYTNDAVGQNLLNPQFSSGINSGNFDPKIDDKFLQNPNFDPRKVPSQFVSQSVPYAQIKFDQTPLNKPGHSAFVPYNNTAKNFQTDDAKSLPYQRQHDAVIPAEQFAQDKPNYTENRQHADTENSKLFSTPKQGRLENLPSENTNILKSPLQNLPNYAPGKYNVHSDTQIPASIPKSVKDLAFSTYDPTNVDPNELNASNPNQLKFPHDPYYDNQNLAKEIIRKARPLDDVNPSKHEYDPGQKSVGQDPNKYKQLSQMHPSNLQVNEDFLEPSQVIIGAIQDINYPEIKASVQGTNDFYEDYSPESIREILNNVKLPDCHYCKKPFEENEFAITIDRANALFHAECFRCAGCNQILADNVYFYNKETDNIYCGRDYAKVRGFPRCKACDELIFTKEYCLAENATFHLKHFCCTECDTPLAGQDYTLEDEMPYCLPCFEQSKASKCSSCSRVIKPDERGCSLNGVHFHATDECFACKVCKQPLMNKKLLLRNEKLFCSHECFGAAGRN